MQVCHSVGSHILGGGGGGNGGGGGGGADGGGGGGGINDGLMDKLLEEFGDEHVCHFLLIPVILRHKLVFLH